MCEKTFNSKKEILLNLLNIKIKEYRVDSYEYEIFFITIELLKKVNYLNKFKYKGALARIVIDQFPLSDNIGDKLISFDRSF
jgi:hypothetical protein